MKTKINRWNLPSAAVFLSILAPRIYLRKSLGSKSAFFNRRALISFAFCAIGVVLALGAARSAPKAGAKQVLPVTSSESAIVTAPYTGTVPSKQIQEPNVLLNILSPCPPSWSAGPNFPAAAVVGAFGQYFPINGRFYAMGGSSSDAAGSDFINPFEFALTTDNPAAGFYSDAVNVAAEWFVKTAVYPDHRVVYTLCFSLTDPVFGIVFVYCFDGVAAGSTTATPRGFSYNPLTDAITTLPTEDSWPGNTTGTILPGGVAVVANKAYIIGGHDIGTGSTAQTWQFDPTAPVGSKWLQRADYPLARSYIPAASIGGVIYTGGGSNIVGTTVTDTADSFKYDPVANVWTPIANIPRATGETVAVVVNDEMWVLGGGRTAPNPSNEVNIYNPGSNTWRLGPPFVTARRNFAAASDGNSSVLVVGGYDSAGTPLNTTEFYGPVCPTPTARALNLSTRMRVQTGDNVGIAGFIISGSTPKHVLIRGIGPSLTGFGVPDALADPVLELHGADPFITITNNNWRDTQEAAILATGIPPTNNLEAAIDATLAPGAYTAVVRGNGNTSGVGLVEVYDLDQGVDSKLANLSTRAFVGTGDGIVIAGVILGNGDGSDRIVVRGIGPSLAVFGVSNALANPTLELRNSNGSLLIANNDWQENPEQAAELTTAGLAPTNQLESGMAATLPPGLYTALLAGLNNGTGVGLVEVYDLGAP